MRILIDLQGNQNNSRERGIGRAALALTKGIIRNAGEHQVFVLLNSLFADTIAPIRAELQGILPQENIIEFYVPNNLQESREENSWRLRAAELTREWFVSAFNPDAVIICSLFEGVTDNTVASLGLLGSPVITAVMVHDLIPLLDPDHYLGQGIFREWYFKKLEYLQSADIFLTISNSATQELLNHLEVDKRAVVNMGSGVDTVFHAMKLSSRRKHEVLTKFGIKRKFLMHTSALDPRKNFEGLVRAFAAIPYSIRKDYQLVLVFKIKQKVDADNFYKLAVELGLRKDELILTGFVTDQQLIELYSLTFLFIFPSFHEGFGLPPLEAMSCGAPAIGSNVTSIPEVIGRADALFDPYSTDSMRQVMQRAMTDEEFWRSLKQHASEHSRTFSWDKTARIAISALEQRVLSKKSSVEVTGPIPVNDLRSFAKQLGLIKAKVAPTEEDYLQVAEAFYKNQLLLDKINAHAHNEKLVWRVEGPFDSSYSLALVNRETARAIKSLGHEVVLHSTEGFGDFAPNSQFLKSNPELAEMHNLVGHYPQSIVDVTSRNIYPPRVSDMHSSLNILHHYAWEESGFPQDWAASFNKSLDGITCTSKHVEKILIDNGVYVPLVNIGNGVDHWERIKPSATYQIKARKFKLLHVSTCLPRKGPLALLDGYGIAFSIDDDVSLIIKTTPNEHNKVHHWIEERRASNPKYPHIVVIEDDISNSDLKALYQQCDVLVQPACAEGFGLPMAEAMLSGIPVITTGWSGQLEFCTNETAWLVDYDFAAAKTHFDLYFSSWANVRIDDLAAKMREVYQLNKKQRIIKANLGRKLLLEQFTWRQTAAKAIESTKRWNKNKQSALTPKIGWITTWNTRCGIATYSEHLIDHFPSDREVMIFASSVDNPQLQDEANVRRSWHAGPLNNKLDNISELVFKTKLNTLIIQFNNGLFNFDELGEFIEEQLKRGLILIVVMHSTNLYANFGGKLHGALSKCHRLLVHSIHDLNNLKSANLVDNVCLFPHGTLKYPESDVAQLPEQLNRLPLIATYGFCFPHKGLAEIIQAIALLKHQGTPVRLRLVNAEYPTLESSQLIAELKQLVKHFKVSELVEFHNDFLTDDGSFELLKDADLISFAYQNTEESASGAVRYGLALQKPVIVTPLRIFDDLGDAVFRFEGRNFQDIARGISSTLKALSENSEIAQRVEQAADRWRATHDYKAVSQRLYNINKALLNYYKPLNFSYFANSADFKVDCGISQGRTISTKGVAGRLLYGPFINLPAGEYEITVKGLVRNLGTTCYMDVVSDAGTKLLALQALSDLPTGELASTIVSSSREINSLEVRIFVGEDTDLEIQTVDIKLKSSAEELALPNRLTYSASDKMVKTEVGMVEGRQLVTTGRAGELCNLIFPAVEPGRYTLRVYGEIDYLNKRKPYIQVSVGHKLFTQQMIAQQDELISECEFIVLDTDTFPQLSVFTDQFSKLKINLIELLKKPEPIKLEFKATDKHFSSATGKKLGNRIYSTGTKGHLLYGPYLSLPKGIYRIILLGSKQKIDSRSYIEAVADKAEKVLHKTFLKTTPGEELSDFEVVLEKEVTDLEIRVWLTAQDEVSISRILISEVTEKKKEGRVGLSLRRMFQKSNLV